MTGVLDSSPGDDLVPYPISMEIGRAGLRRTGGYVDDEFLPQLRARKAVKVYREMLDNSATLGGFMNAVTLLLRQIEWRVEAASDTTPQAQADADFLQSCMDDMENTWGDTVLEIASFIPYGWSLHEPVYKIRGGPWERDPKKKSKYTDGAMGWQKIPGRAQETMLRWKFTETDEVEAMIQMAPPRYEKRVLDMERMLLFRTRPDRSNPEGRSVFRNAYSSWWNLKRLEEIELIGAERDLAGMPVAKVPAKILAAKPGTPDYEMLQAVRTLVTKTRRNEHDGIVWPFDVDPDTKQPEYMFELMTSGGSRQFDLEGIITRYQTQMLQSVLADFLQVGHENVGSYNMHTDKRGLFQTTINAYAQIIADQFNRHAIPRLFALNGNKPPELPKIVPNNVDPPELSELGGFIQVLTAAGYQLFPDPELEKFLRDAAQLPAPDPQVEAMREQEQRQQAIIDLSNQQLQMVQVEQAAAQGQLGLQQQAMDNEASAQQITAGPEQEQGPSADETAQAGEKTKQSKLKTAQEKQKLSNLKAKGKESKAKPKKKVKKSDTTSAFGVDHGDISKGTLNEMSSMLDATRQKWAQRRQAQVQSGQQRIQSDRRSGAFQGLQQRLADSGQAIKQKLQQDVPPPPEKP